MSFFWMLSRTEQDTVPPYPMRYRIRVKVLRNDGPIGQNYEYTELQRYLPGTPPYPWGPADWLSGFTSYVLNDTYPHSPMEFRVRVQLVPSVQYPPHLYEPSWNATARYLWENAWTQRTWYAYALLVRQFVQVDMYRYRAAIAIPLPPYQPQHGTTSSVPRFDYSLYPYEQFQYAEMARNVYNETLQIIPAEYSQLTYDAPLGTPPPMPATAVADPAITTGYSITLSGADAQFPHRLPIPFPDYTTPVPRYFRWELEFYVRDDDPFYDAATDRYYTVVYFNVGYTGTYNYIPRGGRCGEGLWLFLYMPRTQTGEPPFGITSCISLHNRSHDRLLVANNTQLQRRSLFSLTAQSPARTFADANRLQRVREVPRRDSVCVLERRGSTAPYTFKVHHEDPNGVQEVMTVTGKSALIEMADTRNEALVILQDNNDAVYAYRSLNGGWTWDTGTRCQLGGNDMTASSLHDLDFSVRRNVYFLSATVSGAVKVLVSEDGVNWTDTGV